ncbi:polysaccharide deacetylase family protein [Mesonia sp. K7]|uniref:polysaccharide deacetylase family protein n=1 Tax=Mesonia sp. K7 TaxID=2218606 RepID=UPI000DA88495|nr:polysaccharide deacetylase family protein [Mesonia sp. K7]PZD76830.1 polysaccharide deacetylase family protein [Mesonia sp. K7]
MKYKVVNLLFFVIFIIVLVLIYQSILPIISLIYLLLLYLAVTFAGATIVRWNYFFEAYHHNKSTLKNEVSITFDDGPTANTLEILNILDRFDAKATFFCIGHKIDERPEVFKAIIAKGHTVANHTYSHPKNYGFLSTKTVVNEIESCNLAIKNHSGLISKLYRTPFGNANPKIKRALQKTGLTPIGWSIRSFDTLISSKKIILKRVTSRVKKGDIILLHDSQMHTNVILEQLLLFLKNKNLKSVTVDQLLNLKAYED